MADEEKTQDQIEGDAWTEATKEDSVQEETDESQETASEEDQEEEDQKEAGGDQEESKEPEEADYKAQAKELTEKLEKAEKKAMDNKRFADDQARMRAEEKKAREQEKEQIDLEKPPEDVKALIEEYPSVERAIEFFGKAYVQHALTEYNEKLKEATGGIDPAEYIKEMRGLQDQVTFERMVTFGYYDGGDYVPGHPDVMEVTRSPEFLAWMQAETKRDPSFETRQNDPVEAIKIVSQYKASRLKEAGKKQQEKLDKTKEEVEEDMSTATRDMTRKTKPKQPDKYDEKQAALDAGFTA